MSFVSKGVSGAAGSGTWGTQPGAPATAGGLSGPQVVGHGVVGSELAMMIFEGNKDNKFYI